MLKEAKVIGPAHSADKGVRTRCVGTWKNAGIAMETEYVNFQRGIVASIKLTNRPIFFSSFAATIRHDPISKTHSRLNYTYSFKGRPQWLASILNPILNFLLKRETQKRLKALKSYLEKKN